MIKFGIDIDYSLVLNGVRYLLLTVIVSYYGKKYSELYNDRQRLLNNLYSFVKNKDITATLKKIWPIEYKDLFDLSNLEDPNAIYKKSSSFLSIIDVNGGVPTKFKDGTIPCKNDNPRYYIHANCKPVITRLLKLVEPIEKIDAEIKNLLMTNNKPLIHGFIAIAFSSLILVLESITLSGNKYSAFFAELADFWFQLKPLFIGFIVCLAYSSVEGLIKSYFNK